MYIVSKIEIPKEYSYTEYVAMLIKDIKNDINAEENKDKLFRLTFPLMMGELKKYNYVDTIEELMPDLSIAFMNTIKYFDPNKPKTSFINYFRIALKSEVLKRYWGKYFTYKEKRDAYAHFNSNIDSLDKVIPDANGVETARQIDLVVDETIIIDEEIREQEINEALYRAIDKVFSASTQGQSISKMERARNIVQCYIDHKLADEKITYEDIGEKFGIYKSSVHQTIQRYLPRLKVELEREGYYY